MPFQQTNLKKKMKRKKDRFTISFISSVKIEFWLFNKRKKERERKK